MAIPSPQLLEPPRSVALIFIHVPEKLVRNPCDSILIAAVIRKCFHDGWSVYPRPNADVILVA
jgi:hypothetical protein